MRVQRPTGSDSRSWALSQRKPPSKKPNTRTVSPTVELPHPKTPKSKKTNSRSIIQKTLTPQTQTPKLHPHPLHLPSPSKSQPRKARHDNRRITGDFVSPLRRARRCAGCGAGLARRRRGADGLRDGGGNGRSWLLGFGGGCRDGSGRSGGRFWLLLLHRWLRNSSGCRFRLKNRRCALFSRRPHRSFGSRRRSRDVRNGRFLLPRRRLSGRRFFPRCRLWLWCGFCFFRGGSRGGSGGRLSRGERSWSRGGSGRRGSRFLLKSAI
ncbi:hypothetical protein BDV98DRAFT_129089 [Pterulicium gracile]|uniref:Uncharacterized protein n=1 Tax=Pterulicium gracile TaxID=1884261 RepID=A0A5C3QNE0_9AGAR|nr:hypothetical protein BDV98DRAFT_129089 [Pterula gracilis]